MYFFLWFNQVVFSDWQICIMSAENVKTADIFGS